MARSYTTDDIIELIKLNDALPEDAGSFQDSDYLKLMNQEMMVGLLPQMLKVHEEYYTYEHQVTIVSGTSSYAIPHRATGSKLRDLRWINSDSFYNTRLTRYNIEDVDEHENFYQSTRFTNGFYLKNNTINLINTTVSTGTLGMMIYLRPNEFVLSSRGCTITAINTDTGVITVDSSLVSGFLQAVSGMGGEISGGEASAVRKIDYGQFCVSSSGTDCITTYLFSTAEVSKDVEQGLTDFVEWFEKKFHAIVASATWDGNTDEFNANARAIIDTLSESLFVWTLHPLTVNVVKEKEVTKLDQLSQKIYKFIKDYKEVSISVALEYFNKSPIEETLSKLFELVDNTFLLRKRLRK